MRALAFSSAVLLLTCNFIQGQDSASFDNGLTSPPAKILSGFIRGGLYTWADNSDILYIPSAFSDLGLKLETGNSKNFRAFADVRYRFGSEFLKPVSKIDIREAWVNIYGKKWNLSVGE